MAASGRCVRVRKKRSSGAVWGVIASHRPANGSAALRAWKRFRSDQKGQEQTPLATGKKKKGV